MPDLASATQAQLDTFARSGLLAFNPHQRRGPDGRWIRLPTSELKRPRRPRGGGRPRSHVSVKQHGGKNVYTVGGRERKWTPAEARAVADALDATVAGESVPPPVAGRVVSDGVRRRTVEQVQPFRGANGNVILDVGRDHGQEGSGEVELTNAQARKLAQDLREHADREEGVEPSLDPPGYAAQLPPVNLPDPQIAYREARDEYNISVYNVAWTMRQRNQDARRPDAYLDHLMLEYDSHSTNADRDRTINGLRQHLNTYYDGDNGVLDPAPDEATFLNVPSLPPGPRTVGGPRPPAAAPLPERHAALDRSVRSGLDSQDTLSGGAIADTRRVQLGDGTDAIYKRAKRTSSGRTPEDQTDAEELASLVANAIGVRAPAIQRASPNELYMEVMPGTSAMAHGWKLAPDEVVTSPQGRKLGLLDVLINNGDRHTGNWMWDDGELSAIDHGFSFFPDDTEWTYSAFTNGFRRGANPLTPSDISRLRGQLETVKPQFEALGRGDWYRRMLLRLNRLDAEASGSVDLYPGAAVTAAQRGLFARSGLLAYGPPRGGTA